MSVLGWTLIGVGLGYLCWFAVRWVAFNTRLPIGWSDEQRAKSIMRQGARWDIEDAVDQATKGGVSR